jgi:hypothetical protein
MMATSRDRAFLLAELGELDRLIAEADPSSVLTRASFEARRDEVHAELAELEAQRKRGRHGRVALMFKGNPVFGRKGVLASFAGPALAAYQALVERAAAARRGALGERGPVPEVVFNQLMITGTAPGSFGFILEESAPEAPLLIGSSDLAAAIETTGKMIRASTDDDTFAEMVEEQGDARVIDALSDFLRIVRDNGATLELRADDLQVELSDPDEIAQAAERTETARTEDDQPIPGILRGILPETRRFELLRSDTGEIITGRIWRELADPDELKHRYEDQEVVAHMRVVTFSRRGKERHKYELRRLTAKMRNNH